ncbi:MAG TPA: YggT family protein [Gemmatimonadaceae bacterium]|jgi:YggT family protein|nr:YggT family protein [Gemmatimonadaceae bacterium]
MDTFQAGADIVIRILRIVLLSTAVVFAVICLLDWAVRMRKISPFNAIARFCRSTVDPILVPIERRIVRAGGTPAAAPLWALAVIVIGGIVLLTAIDMIRLGITKSVVIATGPSGIIFLLVSWTFTILKAAIIVRVVSSWLPISPYSKWVSWSYKLSEPMLAPLRRIVPSFGGLDVTPIIVYILLSILESFVFRLI